MLGGDGGVSVDQRDQPKIEGLLIQGPWQAEFKMRCPDRRVLTHQR
jgi:hypothetical protein